MLFEHLIVAHFTKNMHHFGGFVKHHMMNVLQKLTYF